MRILTLPASFLLAFLLYLPFPSVVTLRDRALCALHARIVRLFTGKKGRADEKAALAFFLLALSGCAALIGAIHPLCASVICAPVFSAPACLSLSASVKRTLDSGAFADNFSDYEAQVRETCADFAPAFVTGACAPMVLLAIGTPLYLGSALAWAYAGLRACAVCCPAARRISEAISRAAESLFVVLLVLCCGAVGRNPLRTDGKGARSRLLSILGIADGEARTHAPVSGDIVQAAFLCCFCMVLLAVLLSLVLLPLV